MQEVRSSTLLCSTIFEDIRAAETAPIYYGDDCTQGLTFQRWIVGNSSFLACPEKGARLMQWAQSQVDGDTREIIYWPEDANLDNFAKVRGGNPILFPFSARSYHQGEIGYWQDSQEIVRSMPMHGFTRDGTFKLTELGAGGFTAELLPTEAAREAYPFAYRFTVRYAFEPSSLRVYFELENLDACPISWSAGHHFYFKLPWSRGMTRADYQVTIPAAQAYGQAEDGRLEELSDIQPSGCFDDPKVSDTIFSQLHGNEAVINSNDLQQSIRLRILEDCEASSE